MSPGSPHHTRVRWRGHPSPRPPPPPPRRTPHGTTRQALGGEGEGKINFCLIFDYLFEEKKLVEIVGLE